MDRGRLGRGNGGSPLAAPRRPRTSGFRELPGQLPKDTSKPETDSEMQDSPGSDVPPIHTLAQALARQKRKRPGSANDPGDDSLDESGSGEQEDTGDKQLDPAKRRGTVGLQGDAPSKIPRRARSVLAKRLDPLLPARGNDFGAAPYASSPSAASLPSGRGPRRGRMPQKMRNSNKIKRQEMAAAAATVSEQEREVAEALFGLANMAALLPSSPPLSPARSASPAAKREEAIADSPNTAVNDAAAALVQACSPALSVEGDDDSQPIISLRNSAPASFGTSMEDKKQVGQKHTKREGHSEDGAPPASTNLPALEATAVVPLKRKRPRARAKAEPISASKDGGALAVLGAAAANLVEESSKMDAKMEAENLVAPGLDVLAASVDAAKDLGQVEKPLGPPIAAFKAEKKRAAAEKKAKAEAAEKLAQGKADATDGDDGKGGLDVSEGNVPIIAPKTKEPRKRKEKENKSLGGEKKEKKRSKVDADGAKKSSGNKATKAEAEPEFAREGSYSDKSDREPIKPASQKSAKAAKREALAASMKAEKAAEKEPVPAPPVARPSPVMQPVAPTASPALASSPSSAASVPASATASQGPLSAGPAWAQPNMSPMFYNQAMAAAVAAATWPNQLPMDGREGGSQQSPAQGHLPSYMMPPLPRPWKRCAFHVYIAHYIEYQQTLLQLSNAGVFLRLPQPPQTPVPMAFGGTGPPPPSINGTPSSGPHEPGPGPTPSAAIKSERGPVPDTAEGSVQQAAKERGSAFHDTGVRKLSQQQPAGPIVQPTSKSQYSAPPPQSTSPPGSQQAPAPASEAPQALSADPSSKLNQGGGQGGGQSGPTNNQGVAQANAQAAYAAQQLALLQQNGYPFPFNPASLNLPPFPVPGASAHFAGLSPAALAQYMAYMQHIGVPPGLPPQLMHGHQAPSEQLPQPAATPSSTSLDIKPTPLTRPNLNQQPMQLPRAPPQQSEPPRDEREQKVRPNLNNRPLRPPQQGDNLVREINNRKHFEERGGQTRPQPAEGGGAMMNFLEQQSREQQARQQQQKMGAPYQRPPFELPPAFLQNPELLYQNKLPHEMLSGWKDGAYKQTRHEGPPTQPQQAQRHPSLGGNERNGPPQSSIGPGPLGLNPAAAGMVPRGHTTMMGTPGMLPPGPNMGPMPQNISEILAEAQRRGLEQEAQRPRPPTRTEELAEIQRRGLEEEARRPRVPTLTEELAIIQQRGIEQERQKRERQERDRQRPASEGNHQGPPPDGGLQQYREMYMQQMNDGRMQQPQPQPQVQRGGPPPNETAGQRGRDGAKSGSKQGGKASPSLDLEGPSAGISGPQLRGGLGPQGPHSFAQPQRSGGGQTVPAQGPTQKPVMPRGKHAPLGPPGQQFPAGPERMGSSGQQMGMQKGYPFAGSSGPGPNFGTGGLGSSSGRPIASQSFGALSQQPQQQQKQMSQGGGLSMGSGQPGLSGPNQMSRLVDLSAPNQQRPVGPGGGNYLQRTGSLGPIPHGQGNPPKGVEPFPRQQGKNGKGSGSANFSKPSSNAGVVYNQQRLPTPAHNMPPGMVPQQHMVGMPMPGGDDKSWQYRNHGNAGGDAKPAGKKAEDDSKKKAERERRQAQKRQKEHTEFELQFLQDQQHHDQQKKQAAAAAAAHQANEQYAAFAQAKKFAPGALLFPQQQNKAQPSGGVPRQQQGAKGGQSQGAGVAAGSANMHAQGAMLGGPGDLGAGLTLGRNPSGNATPSTGVGNGSRGGVGVASRGHMQMARPVSRGGANSARLPMSAGTVSMPSSQKQGPVPVPVSRQSPPMPAQTGPERSPLDGSSPRGAQGRDGGGGVQGPQPVEHQLAKPELPRQGYKAPTDMNGLRGQPDFALLARPPMSAPSSLQPSTSRPPNSAPPTADAAPARSFEANMGNLALPGKLPVRDAPMQTPSVPTHGPSGGTQVPFLVRESSLAPSKDANPHVVPDPRIRSPPQERAILPVGDGEGKGLGK